MNGYPYPVLTEIDSSYKDDVCFLIEFLDYEYKNDSIEVKLSLLMNSQTLKSYIESGKAEIVIKTVTDIRTSVFRYSELIENVQLSLKCENVKSNDTIKLTAYIVAKESFELNSNDEILDLFGEAYSINLRKGDILAISNEEKLNYTTTNNDFIKITSLPERDGKGLFVRLSNDNYIEIVVGNEFKHAYAATKNPKLSPIIDSHIIFEAIVFALVEIAQGKEDYSEKEWFRLFSQAYEATGETLQDFKEKAYDEIVDMAYVFEKAQEMISNSLENSLIKISKMEG